MTQLWRFIESSLAQEFQAHVDFQRLCEEWLTGAYGDLHILAIGWSLWARGKPEGEGIWYSLECDNHLNMLT